VGGNQSQPIGDSMALGVTARDLEGSDVQVCCDHSKVGPLGQQGDREVSAAGSDIQAGR